MSVMIGTIAILVVAVVEGALLLPGVSPVTYSVGQPVPLHVNSLRSTRNVMPMDWYSMPWCAPPSDVRKQYKPRRNLGEVLWGDNVEMSLYDIRMMRNVTCAAVCPAKKLTVKDNEVLRKRVEEGYRGHLILDGLPVAEEGSHQHSRLSRTLTMGFPVGIPERLTGSRAIVFNHLAFTVLYHPYSPTGYLPGEDDADTFRIVGFVVTPLSIDHSAANYGCGERLTATTEAPPVFADARTVTWSYSVQFEFSDVEWSTRWDVYLKSSPAESRIHWFAIVNSLVVVGVLTAVIALILLRALRRDIARYNDPEALQEEREETGWKLVHGDVFRRPPRLGLLSVLVGSGMQVLCMCGAALVVACVGFATPQRRGSVLSVLIFLYVLLGFVGGFTTAVLANSFRVKSWRLIIATGVLLPGTLFVVYFALNLIHWGNRASSATPLTTMVALLVLWLFVSLPLVLLGGGSGYRTTLTYPRHVLTIARTIPPQPWQVSMAAALLLPGIFPFGASFVEATFILGSVWQGRVYHVFGFLALSFVIAAVTAAEATVVLVYVQLLQLDYRWWWKSFCAGGSVGVWVLLFSVVYYRVLPIAGWWASLLYFGYMTMASYVLFVMMGALCFCVTLVFVRVIYASLKID